MSCNVFKHLVFIFHFCINEKSTILFPEIEHEFHPMWSLAWNVAQASNRVKVRLEVAFYVILGKPPTSVPQSLHCEVETVISISISTRAGGIMEITVL